MKTSKISAKIARVSIAKNAFKIHFQDNQNFVIEKDERTQNFNPLKGQTLTLGFYRGMLCELSLDGEKVFAMTIEELLSKVTTLKNVLIDDAKKLALYKELPNHPKMIKELPLLMQYRILLCQIKMGNEYRYEFESGDIQAMQLAVALKKDGNITVEDFQRQIPSRRDEFFEGAGKMQFADITIAFKYAKALLLDQYNSCEDGKGLIYALRNSNIMQVNNSHYPPFDSNDFGDYAFALDTLLIDGKSEISRNMSEIDIWQHTAEIKKLFYQTRSHMEATRGELAKR